MPANLTPQYYAAEERYKQAKDDKERLNALKEMLGIIPKHKGTEKLQGEIKRKIARLKEVLESGKSKKGTKRFSFRVEKEGAGQVALVGLPNSGKSQLVNSLTNAHFDVADYPFTTRMFQPAMMPYEDIQIQLIDLPPFSIEFLENWVPTIAKNSDIILIVLDLGRDDLLEQVDIIFKLLEQNKIVFSKEEYKEKDFRWTFLKSIFVGNKFDLQKSKENFLILNEFYGEQLNLNPVSATEKLNLENLKLKIVNTLDIVRIYSKKPGTDADFENPYVFPRGSTLLDFASAVHKDFAMQLKFARVWGENKFEGQRITKEYILEDRDIIELHI